MKSEPFLESFHDFISNNSGDVRMNLIAKEVKQLFKLQSQNPHPSHL